jgi:nitroreductase
MEDEGRMMPFDEAVEGRHSVRRYRTDAVPRADVERMVYLATRAASAGNAQVWRFIAVQDPSTQEAMKRAVEETFAEIAAWRQLAGHERDVRAVAAYATFFARAPLCIAVCGLPYSSRTDRLLDLKGVPREERDRLRQRPDIQSVGAAVQLLITAAHAMGYGSCWMTAPVLAAERLEQVLGVEPPAQLVALVPVGKPAGRIGRSKRLPLDAVLSFR